MELTVSGGRRRRGGWKGAAGTAVLLLLWGVASALKHSGGAQALVVPWWAGVGISLVAPFGLVVLLVWVSDRREQARYHAVEAAAAEAATDDPAFAADLVRAAAEQLFRDAWGAWEARDRDRLSKLMTPEAATGFARGMERNDHHVSVSSVAGIDLVSLINRGSDQDDRVTVHIRAKLQSYLQVPLHENKNERLAPAPYWTLSKRDGRWIVHKIESHNRGAYHLKEPIVTGPNVVAGSRTIQS